jgi:hypothetical protein
VAAFAPTLSRPAAAQANDIISNAISEPKSAITYGKITRTSAKTRAVTRRGRRPDVHSDSRLDLLQVGERITAVVSEGPVVPIESAPTNWL